MLSPESEGRCVAMGLTATVSLGEYYDCRVEAAPRPFVLRPAGGVA
jgi:hypothetical protein